MIYWITGRRNSGKTTLAYKMKELLEGVEEPRSFVMTCWRSAASPW